MALQPGFDRYEGLAYFGYTRDGDGFDAIVNIGEKFIEIKNSAEQPLSLWAPHSFECNGLDIPMRCYFSGDEWIAPRDWELADFLDQYLDQAPLSRENFVKPRPSKLRIALWSTALLGIAGIFGYFVLQSSLSSLINPSITANLDQMIATSKFTSLKICDQETEPLLHDYLREKAPKPEYQIVTNLGVNFVRLPSGTLAIDSNWVQTLENENSLIALLNLTNARNEAENPARKMIEGLSVFDKISFLRSGQLNQTQIDKAWAIYIKQPQLLADDVRAITDPIGNYADIAAKGNLPASVGMPNISAGLEFGKQDWLTMITMCPVDN